MLLRYNMSLQKVAWLMIGMSVIVFMGVLGIIYLRAEEPISFVGQFDGLTFPSVSWPIRRTNQLGELSLIAQKNKDYSPVEGLARVVRIEASTTAEGIEFSAPEYAASSSFDLVKQINDSSYVTMIFDQAAKKLHFQIGGEEYRSDNVNRTESASIVAEVTDVSAEDAFTFLGTTYALGAYKNDASFTIGQLRNASYSVLSATGTNLLVDRQSDFRYGLWAAQPSDCSRSAEGEPQIAMNREWFAGKFFVRLRSTNHFACTSRVFTPAVSSTNIYSLSFDYIPRVGDKARYYYRFFTSGTSSSLAKSETIDSVNGRSGTLYTIVKPTADYQKMELYFYAPSEKGLAIESLYAQPRLRKYVQTQTGQLNLKLPDQIRLDSLSVAAFPKKLSFFPEAGNLIQGQEASFEAGSWSSDVQDCCSSDPGVPDIAVSYSSEATHGTSSLILTSKSHCACVNKIFTPKLKNSVLYTYSFDYRALTGSKPQATYILSGSSGYSQSSVLYPAASSTDWQRQTEIIDTGKNIAEAMALYFYASTKGQVLVKNQYDNLQLRAFAPKDAAIYAIERVQKQASYSGSMVLSSNQLSRFATLGHLQNIQHSFLLRHRSRFGESMKACIVEKSDKFNGLIGLIRLNLIGSESCIESRYHYAFSDGTNGWWFDKDKWCNARHLCQQSSEGLSQASILLLKPMGQLMAVLIVAVTAFITSIGISIYLFTRNRGSKKN